MNLTILQSSADHPVNAFLDKWISKNQLIHDVHLVRSKNELIGGDLLFLISCSEIITKEDRKKYKKVLVIHASDLPKGRGWSPHVWEIINGSEEITLSLLEAEDTVDSGDIWNKVAVNIPKTALFEEINYLIFEMELWLMDFAVQHFHSIVPIPQSTDTEVTYWPKRKPEDSEIDVNRTISDQFDAIRVCDINRFPAFFYKDGKKFLLKVEAVDE